MPIPVGANSAPSARWVAAEVHEVPHLDHHPAVLDALLHLRLRGHQRHARSLRRGDDNRRREVQERVAQLVDADAVTLRDKAVVHVAAQVGYHLDELERAAAGDLAQDFGAARRVVLVAPRNGRGDRHERRTLAELAQHRRLRGAVTSAAETADDPQQQLHQ